MIHLQGRNLIFIIKNLILATTIKKSQKKLKLKAKEWGCDKGQINIKIIKPSKKPKPPDLRNGIKARKRGEHWVLIWIFFLLGEKHLLLAA